jgi:CheY-like chemotaxis protein
VNSEGTAGMTGTEGDGPRPFVLVVEDEAPVRKALRTFISREGYEVDAAADGVEALEKMSEHRPDIIVLDLRLPRMDGYQLLEALAARYGWGRPKVLVLTGLQQLDLAAIRVGADAYIQKPFDPERMRAALARLALPLRAVRPTS